MNNSSNYFVRTSSLWSAYLHLVSCIAESNEEKRNGYSFCHFFWFLCPPWMLLFKLSELHSFFCYTAKTWRCSYFVPLYLCPSLWVCCSLTESQLMNTLPKQELYSINPQIWNRVWHLKQYSNMQGLQNRKSMSEQLSPWWPNSPREFGLFVSLYQVTRKTFYCTVAVFVKWND